MYYLRTCTARVVMVLAAVLLWPATGSAERLKDLAGVQGVRSNQLLGYGLVVGLTGTGDGSSAAPFTAHSLRNMLAQYGITVPPEVTMSRISSIEAPSSIRNDPALSSRLLSV